MDHISRVGLFLEVVKHQSFAGAARTLGLTGPALSKQVQSLEDQLGVRLLNRTTRQVTLTEEGAIYSERARKALEDLAEAEQQIQERKANPTGVLRINAPMAFGRHYLTQPIAAFAKKYSDLQMEVDFDDRLVDVIGEGYDVVVRIGAMEDSSLIARKLAPCPLILCASASYLEQYGRPKTPKDLSNYPAIIYTRHGNENRWRYQDSNSKISTTALKQSFAANNAEMMLEACLQGLGMTILPIFAVATYLKSGQLVEIFPDHRSYPERGLYATFPQNRHLSIKVRLFVDWLSECSKAFPW
ncbi:MAG: LysR family transcriptional regulator [Rhizobiaceae bacterium]|nr:LysR family transcriptional regulator [Rhizobiaceae bacterium]